MNQKNEPKEFSFPALFIGILLAVIFGAANAYLGLRVGMTVSASIPAAVISLSVMRVILRRKSILESNLVQTIGSAGESLAAGAIFTLPTLFLWSNEGKMNAPSVFSISLIAIIGGLLGVLFMIPLRNALIVKEDKTLPYPEGRACAKVLMAADDSKNGATKVFIGMGAGAFFKFLIDGIKIVQSEVSIKFRGFYGEIGTQIYPAVMSVGYICGPKIASYMFSGGVLSWLVIIPMIVIFGDNTVLYPGTSTIQNIYSNGGSSAIWSTYVRYIGAGALATGGIISLIKSFPLIVSTFIDAIKSTKGTLKDTEIRTAKSIKMKYVFIAIILLTLAIWLFNDIPVSLLGAAIVVFFGFFFATVSSRMVGLVGSSNNPVSGMAIATLLIATVILKTTGDSGIHGMQGAIAIGSIICIIAAIAGDTSQDLKTGFLLGATPKKQQIGELIGVTVSAITIGSVLFLLDKAWGFGGGELGAPQATLMKMIVEGVMDNNLPWGLVFVGIFIALTAEILKIPVLPFAIGIYLPVHLNACIMAGGLVRLFIENRKCVNHKSGFNIKSSHLDNSNPMDNSCPMDNSNPMDNSSNIDNSTSNEHAVNNGILYCSGLIAGEGLMGIILAIFAILGIEKYIDLSSKINIQNSLLSFESVIIFLLIIGSLIFFSRRK